MKRTLISTMVAFLVAGLLSVVSAAEKKEVTLKGDLVCGECALKETKGCANVLVVKEGDEEVHYVLAKNEVSKEYDKKTCGGEKVKATVIGTVAEKDGKKTLTATKITEG